MYRGFVFFETGNRHNGEDGCATLLSSAKKIKSSISGIQDSFSGVGKRVKGVAPKRGCYGRRDLLLGVSVANLVAAQGATSKNKAVCLTTNLQEKSNGS